MFRDWGFLLGEIWALIVLAALVGVIAGWIIFGQRKQSAAGSGDAAQFKADLDRSRAMHADKDDRIRALEAEISSLRVSAKPRTTPPAPVPIFGFEDGVKPATLATARGTGPDDLKRIKGIGPRLERMCFDLGFYHFDQIASWTPEEVAWVDANLEGFAGRVTRDNWVAQAKILAADGETGFSKRVDQGDVYS